MKIVFVGDSITAYGNWEAVIDFAEVLNFSVPGGSTDELFTAIPEILASKPDLISVLIGTNDFGNPEINREGSDVGARVIAIINEFKAKLPSTRIILHTILPRGLEASGVDLRPRVIAANDYIKAHVPNDVELIDLWPIFIAPDGLSLADRFVKPEEPVLKLHLNEEGYREWITVLLPRLQRMVKSN